MGNNPPNDAHIPGSTVGAIDDAIKEEMRYSAYSDTPHFVETLFSDKSIPDALVNTVYRILVRNEVYVEETQECSGYWRELPLQPRNEKVLYEPLTKILNAITDALPLSSKSLDIIWRDEHSKPPESQSIIVADMKPDIVATFKNASDTSDGPVWWRAVHIPLEVKRRADPDAAALQLLRYVRQALKEQPDRRFMYGLVFAKYNLTVWHVDHSGALASTAFNVHLEPKTFIRVILGLVVQSPEDLGWDPTMLLYMEDDKGIPLEPLASYLVDQNELPESSRNATETKWVVSVAMPGTAGEDETELEQFVLYHGLSLSRGEVIRGRATRVWRAWKLSHMSRRVEERSIYVYKDTWRDERRGVEGEIYLLIAAAEGRRGVAIMHSHGTVRINGRVDDTLSLIRKSVAHRGQPLKLDTRQITREQEELLSTVDSSAFPSTGWASQDVPWGQDIFEHFVDIVPRVPRNRMHHRLVMSSTGWPLLQFISLSELLGGLSDAVAGHRWLYEQGILHRDISFNNILLTGRPAPNRALLIDLDNAIIYKNHRSIPDDEHSVGTLAFMSQEIITNTKYTFYTPSSDRIPIGVVRPNKRAEPETHRIRHDFVHDLESFFWLMCWMGLSREGPGCRRMDWPRCLSSTDVDVRRVLKSAFEAKHADLIGSQKALYFQSTENIKNLLSMFTSYFSPIVDLLGHLHRVLTQVYHQREFTLDTYDHFIHGLEQFASDPDVIASDESTDNKERGARVQKLRDSDELTWDPQPERQSALKRSISVVEEQADGINDDIGSAQPSPTARNKRARGKKAQKLSAKRK
ncbi:hypothetical protein BV25DRAFT_1829618 [Artomyces pyxidatus]|uniref:Uncharacterized protein n=1 Tax=Artomyces pyxidatus TaxID=48021 RepID=A0ACB8SSN0_9AGAM|nr:hypothetical protein BV25DRAFT_1829618 [Artomyces pyxidatus]